MQCQASYWSTEPEEKGADYILMTISMQIVLNRPPLLLNWCGARDTSDLRTRDVGCV